jgi:serine/threonine protein kinase
MEIFKKTAVGKYEFEHAAWRHVSPQAQDLIQQMLKYDPHDRASAKDCLDHAWFHQDRCDYDLKR